MNPLKRSIIEVPGGFQNASCQKASFAYKNQQRKGYRCLFDQYENVWKWKQKWILTKIVVSIWTKKRTSKLSHSNMKSESFRNFAGFAKHIRIRSPKITISNWHFLKSSPNLAIFKKIPYFFKLFWIDCVLLSIFSAKCFKKYSEMDQKWNFSRIFWHFLIEKSKNSIWELPKEMIDLKININNEM